MNRVIAVVEGQTERTFVRDVLAPWLGSKGVWLSARLVGKPGHKGGVGPFERARDDIVSLLKQESDTHVTTMFDYYGMRESWPGRKRAKSLSHRLQARTVERAIKRDIMSSLGKKHDARRLFPYVQMHEFEALLFSDPSALSYVMRDPGSEADLMAIRGNFESPEEINDNPSTAPSKRIEELFPSYCKPFHATLASKRITVEVMRTECPHFNEWLTTLEQLGVEAGDV